MTMGGEKHMAELIDATQALLDFPGGAYAPALENRARRAIDAVRSSLSPLGEAEARATREIGWLIERRFPADGLEGPRHRWYAESRLDFHWWTDDANIAKKFPTKADAEAFPAYQMIASDPTISITEHVFLGANR